MMTCKLMTAMVLALLAAGVGSQTPAGDEIAWETSLDAAKTRAAADGKPVLLLDMFGRLDEELC